jgi:glycosyltransferase involved in cell wall biosynthesis
MNMKIIINCGVCQDYVRFCLESVRAQTFRRWQAFVTIDACGDETAERAFVARGGDDRIEIRLNSERLYSMTNLIRAIQHSGAEPEDLIVILDGDDWFATNQGLQRIVSEYEQHGCWMTYGSWITNDPSRKGLQAGLWPAYQEGTTRFRETAWLGTAVRTWKKWLWNLIDDRDFRDGNGDYIQVAEDQATMLPMLEMSGTSRARHIADVLMIYNRITPHACGKVHFELMRETAAYVRSRPAYRPL